MASQAITCTHHIKLFIEMPVTCPRCGESFKGNNLGTHVWRCDVTPAELFWMKVIKGNDCWLYHKVDYAGYGHYELEGKMIHSHRAAWIITNGPVPKGQHVLHKCDVRNCCNPEHLFLGTAADNALDRSKKGRSASKLTAEDVRKIKRSKLTNMELSKRFGVGYTAIWSIKSGRLWRHID